MTSCKSCLREINAHSHVNMTYIAHGLTSFIATPTPKVDFQLKLKIVNAMCASHVGILACNMIFL